MQMASRHGDRISAPAAAAAIPLREGEHPLDVLLVLGQDDAGTRRTLQGVFDQLGHRVLTATSVAAAQALLPTFVFDLLICDATLPDGCGADVLGRVPPGLSIHSIVIEDRRADTDHSSGARGFEDMLVKPVNLCLLQRTACRMMGRPL